jgi:hypothetical protein
MGGVVVFGWTRQTWAPFREFVWHGPLAWMREQRLEQGNVVVIARDVEMLTGTQR